MSKTQRPRSPNSFLKRAALIFLSLVFFLVICAGAFWRALQPPSVPVPMQGLTLSNVTIVNPGIDRRYVASLRVEGGVVGGISEEDTISGENSPFAGAYVLPGMIDMHVHYPTEWDRELYSILYLMHGVTTVREMGNIDGTVFETRELIRNGAFPGPSIFTCGAFVDGDPPSWPGSRIVRNESDAEAVVSELSARGADFIKVYNNLTPEALAGIREAAARYSLPVAGHIPYQIPFEDAHIEDVQHLGGVAWPHHNWKKYDQIDPVRIERVVQISLEQGIAHTPTITQWNRLSRGNDPNQRLHAIFKLLPRCYRDVFWNTEDGLPGLRKIPPEAFIALRKGIPLMKQVVRNMHDAGIRIHVGTDSLFVFSVPGASYHEELYHLLDSGFTTEELWIAATRSAGEWLGEPMLGTIQEGAPADLLIFREDPTGDLDALSTLEAVVAQGRLYTKEELDKAFSRHRKHFESMLYEAVSIRVGRAVLK